MNLNIDAQKKNTYDAIVVGSGMTGGMAAKELTERGLTVLMIERGREIKHIEGYDTAMKEPWDLQHRGKVPNYSAEELWANNRFWGLANEKIHTSKNALSTGFGPIIQAENLCTGGGSRTVGTSKTLKPMPKRVSAWTGRYATNN
jgi:choline dehydrogenase-like flavoprotein